MLNWANEDVVTYESDFSAGVDGNTAKSGTVTGNVDSIGGEDDNLSFWADGSTTTHGIVLPQSHFISGNQYLLSVDVYIPSANTNVDKAGIYFSGSSTVPESTNTTDAWVTLTYQFTYGEGDSTGAVRVTQQVSTNNPSYTFTGANSASDDLIYIRNVRITQLTSNAYATTWYDQSGVSVTSTPYTSDFSADVDGWIIGNGTLTAPETIGGVGDALKATINSVNTTHPLEESGILPDDGTAFEVTLDIYVPSTNSVVDGFEVRSTTGTYSYIDTSPTLDTWLSISCGIGTSDVANLRIYPTDGGNLTVNDPGGDDAIYVKNITVKHYDKPHNDATQTTADNQPKVVDAGALVTDDDGNYALSPDGVDDDMFHPTLNLDLALKDIMILVVGKSFSTGQKSNVPRLYFTNSSLAYDNLTVISGYNAGQGIYTLVTSGNTQEVFVNGVSGGTASETQADFDDGNGYRLFSAGSGWTSEPVSAIIIYPSDQSANRSAIEQLLSNTITTALS